MKAVGGLLGVAWVLLGVLVVLLILGIAATPEDWEKIDRLAREVGR